MADVSDDLSADLDDEQPTTSTGVKRLNALPIVFVIAVLVMTLGTALFSIHSVDSRENATNEEENKGVLRSDSFVQNFLAGRPDGLITAADAIEPEPPIEPAPVAPAPEPEPVPEPQSEGAPPGDGGQRDQFAERWEQARYQEQVRVAQLLRGDQERALRAGPAVDFKRGGAQGQGQQRASVADPARALSQNRQQLYDQLGLTGGAGSAGAGPSLASLGAGLGGGVQDYYLQNNQDGKRTFRDSTAGDNHYLGEFRTPAIAALEVKAGSIIPATLITGVNSDLPGQLIAQVSHNVFDTVSGRHVLIPQGAKLVGRYDSSITMGQNRLLVVWDRIIYPDGSSISIKGMQGTDVAGNAGFRDKVNNHYGRIFGHALLLSFVSAAVQLAEDGDDSVAREQDAFTDALAQEIGRVSTELIRRGMNIQPTIEIRPGYPFAVMVNKDMILPPYAPMQDYLANNRSALGDRPARPALVDGDNGRGQ